MSESPTKFRAYGEHAATFLIFQAMANQPGAMVRDFVQRLRNFSAPNACHSWGDISDTDVWLFPNFGKTRGFGEPDVLVLAGPYAFWVEVETTINAANRLPALRKSLLQLWRFRLFQDALTRSAESRFGSRRIVGRTIGNDLQIRRAELRVNGHGVLQKIRRRLRKTGKDGMHHYVLFTVNQPAGEGGDGDGYPKVLAREVGRLSEGYDEELPRLRNECCWYAYWNGHIEPEFNRTASVKLQLANHYVRIKKS